MAHTQIPWKVEQSQNGGRKVVCIVSVAPLFTGSAFPVRVATLRQLKGFAGDAKANGDLIVSAVNAWHDADALRVRINELEGGR